MPKPFLCGHRSKFHLCLCGFAPASSPRKVSSWMPRMLHDKVPSGVAFQQKNVIKCGLEYPSSALPMHWCPTACSWCPLISLPQPIRHPESATIAKIWRKRVK